jgi:hypothetical protein
MASALLAFLLISTMMIAIERTLPPSIQENLEKIGRMEIFSDETLIRTRVAAADAVVGLMRWSG